MSSIASTAPRNAGDSPGFNEQILFWASFLTLIAAGMGFSIRNDILTNWGREFSFTQSELGEIQGMGLFGFGLTIIFFSFFADTVGYGRLMVIAFLLHMVAALTTLAAPYAGGKAGAYLCLYYGALSFSLANGTCEAVINPLTATLFPRNKTHWLNILHAGWPGGLVLGALIGLGINQIPALADNWQIKWAVVLLPILLYGILMLGRPFPTSEATASGVSLREMMRQIGLLGAAVVLAYLGLWLAKDLIPGLVKNVEGLPDWAPTALGWGIAGVLWLVYGNFAGFALGHWMLAFLFIIHGLVGYVELGTDSWIIDITKTVLADPNIALMAFIWTNVLMFTLRFFAGPIVHKISPLGLLFTCAVIGTGGLFMLGLPLTNTVWMWLVGVTIYGIGKTFYWPTMLGVVSERFPRGGALALGLCGGIGMLSAGLLGGPVIGYKQDFAATHQLQQAAPQTYDRYKAATAQAPLPGLPKIAGLDNGKVGVLQNYIALQEKIKRAKEPLTPEQKRLDLERDLEILHQQGKQNEELEKLLTWWQEQGQPHAVEDFPLVMAARLDGGKTALRWTAAVPAAMAVGYLLLILYFVSVGGYKAEELVGHKAEDEKYTGGTTGPGEG